MFTVQPDMIENNPEFRLKQVLAPVITTLLWLLASGLSFLCVFALVDLLIWGMAFALTDPDSVSNRQVAQAINLVQQCSAIILGMIALSTIILSGNYVFGKSRPNAIRNLLRIILVECLIILPVGLLFWW